MSLFAELKRRNVLRAAAAYVVVSWLILQVADVVLPILEAPEIIAKIILFALAMGFPLAMLFAWVFELTPEGIKRESEVAEDQSITRSTGRKLDMVIIGVLAVVIVLMAVERVFFASQEDPVTADLLGPPKSIAVLPFVDLSQAGDQEWFGDGLTEEILNSLAKTPDLLVSSRTSSFSYKGTTKPVREIAQELKVAHVLEGSVRTSPERIRVTAQLIRTSDGFHLWSENYDREPSDMIGIQEDLARNIAMALETTMDPEALAAMTQVGTRSVEAYKEYLQGLYLINESYATMEGQEMARQGYQRIERARQIDPEFAMAHTWAAEYWHRQLQPMQEQYQTGRVDIPTKFANFEERIDLAIATSKTEMERKSNQALKALIELRFRDSARLNRDIHEAMPNNIIVEYALYQAAAFGSDLDTVRDLTLSWKEQGETELTPATDFVGSWYQYGNADEAAEYGLQALERWPDSGSLIYQTHRALLWAGRVEEAKRLYERHLRLFPDAKNEIMAARQACAEGRRSDVEAILKAMEEDTSRADFYWLVDRWFINMFLGRDDEATEMLRPYADSGVPYMLASFLFYTSFDPRPFNELVEVLEQEGINRPPPVEFPFKCPPPEANSIAVLPLINSLKLLPENRGPAT